MYDTNRKGELKFCFHGEHLWHCRDISCSRMFKCQQSYCIPTRLLCDGSWDCNFGTDEIDCSEIRNPFHFCCKGGKTCLHQSELCDGFVQCKRSTDDEELCDLQPCPKHCKCIGSALQCKGNLLSTVPKYSLNVKAVILQASKIKQWETGELILNLLYRLDLSYNNLMQIKYHTFEHSSNLRELDLSYNNLLSIEPKSFAGLKFLKLLYILGNKFTSGGDHKS